MSEHVFRTNWRPFNIPHNKEEATDGLLWLRRRIKDLPGPAELIFPQDIRREILQLQYGNTLRHWDVTEAELDQIDHLGTFTKGDTQE